MEGKIFFFFIEHSRGENLAPSLKIRGGGRLFYIFLNCCSWLFGDEEAADAEAAYEEADGEEAVDEESMDEEAVDEELGDEEAEEADDPEVVNEEAGITLTLNWWWRGQGRGRRAIYPLLSSKLTLMTFLTIFHHAEYSYCAENADFVD